MRSSLLWRSYGRMGFPAELQRPTRTVDREVIYAGHLPVQFGHFILEGLSRLWFAREHRHLPIVWACPSDKPPFAYTDWQRQLLDIVGVTNESILVHEPTRFGRVHVPQAGYRIKDRMAEQQAAFLGAFPARPRVPELRVWLSRAGLPSDHESLHSARLDELVAAAGWMVVRPELLGITQQLELLATASRVAGEEGSALHLLALLSDVGGLQVDIICRRPDRAVADQNQNYQTIAAVKGISQRLHVIPEEHVLDTTFGHVRKVATTLAGHLEALGISHRPGPVESLAEHPAVALVQAVAAASPVRFVLDIGASAGSGTVRAAAGIEVDIVRPAFAIDPRDWTGGTRRYEMPPHEFLQLAATLQRRYDILIIDGPWTAGELLGSQTLSVPVATSGAAWLLRGADDAATREAKSLYEQGMSSRCAALVVRDRRLWLLATRSRTASPWWDVVTRGFPGAAADTRGSP
jgi:hypothetical protein